MTSPRKWRGRIRRLLVLSGDESWTLQQAQALRERLGGDGLWVGPEPGSAPCVAPGALKTLLGREVMHAFFDARRGFDVAAMAALSGTLRAGSWLVLLTPPSPTGRPGRMRTLCAGAIRLTLSLPLTLFTAAVGSLSPIRRCCSGGSRTGHVSLAAPRPDWHPADGRPQAEQAAILEQLIRLPPGIAAVTAERGRGKSALAGMLCASLGRGHRHRPNA